MRNFLYRLCVLFTNLFFPPFAVGMVAGIGTDVFINCCLLLLAVIPAHIHGFYITCVYFHRRRKARKGRYPGGPKPFIYSRLVLNGGYSDATVEELYRREMGLSQQTSRRSNNARRNSYRPDMSQRQSYAQDQMYGSQLSSNRFSRRSRQSDGVYGYDDGR